MTMVASLDLIGERVRSSLSRDKRADSYSLQSGFTVMTNPVNVRPNLKCSVTCVTLVSGLLGLLNACMTLSSVVSYVLSDLTTF